MMTSTSTWRQGLANNRAAEATINNFKSWKEVQNGQISRRGASGDVSAEEQYIQHMVRQNLNAYICHRELDKYVSCLQEKNVISSESAESGKVRVVDVNSCLHKRLCHGTHQAYTNCMQARAHHETIVQSAAADLSCVGPRAKFVECLSKNAVIESQTHIAQCSEPYRVLIRCGLNHLWNRYWRALVDCRDLDEFHLYELERDDSKRQDYLNFIERMQSSHAFFGLSRQLDMPDSSKALAKVQTQLAQRRARIDDFFFQYDHLRTGRVTAEQFCRVLAVNNVSISSDEMSLIVQACTETCSDICELHGRIDSGRDSQQNVSYAKFLNMMRQLETNESPNPDRSSIAPPQACASPHTRELAHDGDWCNAEAKATFDSVTRQLRHVVCAEGVHMKPYFTNFDTLHTGKITRAQFIRAVSSVMGNYAPVDSRDMDLLCEKYTNEQGQVCYQRFLIDVQSAGNHPSKTIAPTDQAGTTYTVHTNSSVCDNSGRTAKELIEILRHQSAYYRLRCEDYFYDYDKLRSGIVSASQFESALGRLALVQFQLAQSDVHALICAYQVKDANAPLLPCVLNGNHHLDSNAVKASVRVNYMSFLQDLCATNGGAGEQAVGSTGRHLGSASDASRCAVNYFERTHNPNIFFTSSQDERAADAVVARVRRFISSTRTCISPVLRDFDRALKSIHEHRTCTRSRFVRALTMLSIELTETEMQYIVRKYTVPRCDGAPSDEVNYYQFVLDVEPAAHMQQKQPRQAASVVPSLCNTTRCAHPDRNVCPGVSTQNHKDIRLGNATSKCNSNAHRCCNNWANESLGSDGRRIRGATTLDLVLADIAEQTAQRELRVGEYFIDFDPLRSGVVSWSKFITALGLAGVRVERDESLRVLQQAYSSSSSFFPVIDQSAPCSGIHGTDSIVDVRRFVADVACLVSCSTPRCTGSKSSISALDDTSMQHKAVTGSCTSSGGVVDASPTAAKHMCCNTGAAVYTNNNSNTILNSDDGSRSNQMYSEELCLLLNRLRHETRIHGALLTPFFAEFDHHNRGTITQTQFRQALTSHRFTLTEREFQLLVARYSNARRKLTGTIARGVNREDGESNGDEWTRQKSDDTVNYRRFVCEVGCGEEGKQAQRRQHQDKQDGSNFGKTANHSRTHATANRTNELGSGDVELLRQTMTKVCLFLQQRRPRMSEFFLDGDELRHGHVSGARFRHCLCVLGLDFLTEAELSALEGAFSTSVSTAPDATSDACSISHTGERRIAYPRFLQTVRDLMTDGEGLRAVTRYRNGDSAFGQREWIRAEIDGGTRHGDDEGDLQKGGCGGAATQSDRTRPARAGIDQVIQKVRHLLSARRTVSLPAFREYDRTRKGLIKEGQFFTCLLSLGLQLTPHEVSTLRAAYSLSGGEIRYTPFAREVDDPTFVLSS